MKKTLSLNSKKIALRRLQSNEQIKELNEKFEKDIKVNAASCEANEFKLSVSET